MLQWQLNQWEQFEIEALKKAMMARSIFKNVYLKTQNSKNCIVTTRYHKQRNFCTNLLKKIKLNIFVIFVIFWKRIKPFFSDKDSETNNMFLKKTN